MRTIGAPCSDAATRRKRRQWQAQVDIRGLRGWRRIRTEGGRGYPRHSPSARTARRRALQQKKKSPSRHRLAHPKQQSTHPQPATRTTQPGGPSTGAPAAPAGTPGPRLPPGPHPRRRRYGRCFHHRRRRRAAAARRRRRRHGRRHAAGAPATWQTGLGRDPPHPKARGARRGGGGQRERRGGGGARCQKARPLDKGRQRCGWWAGGEAAAGERGSRRGAARRAESKEKRGQRQGAIEDVLTGYTQKGDR